MSSGQRQAVTAFWFGLLGASAIGAASFHAEDIRESLALSPLSEAFAVSAITLVGALFGMPIAAAVSRSATGGVLALGAVVLAASDAVAALCGSETVFLLSRGVTGFGFTSLAVAAPTALARIVEERPRRIALSMWGSYLPIGIALGMGLAASVGPSWRTTFAIHAAVTLASAGLSFGSPLAGPAPGEARAGARHTLADPVLLCFAAGFACFAALFLAVTGLLPAMLRTSAEVGSGASGVISGLVCLASTPVSLYLALYPPRLDSFFRGVSTGFALSAAAGALLFIEHGNTVLAPAMALLVVAAGAPIPCLVFTALPSVADGRNLLSLNGMVAQFGSLGSLAGPPLVALSTSRLGWSGGLIPFCGLCALGSALFWCPARRISRGFAGPTSAEADEPPFRKVKP